MNASKSIDKLFEEKPDRTQAAMNHGYARWQKGGDLENKSREEFYAGLQEPDRIAVIFGNMNYQIHNGGISQWIFNHYADPSMVPLTEYCSKLSGECPSFKGVARILEELGSMADDEGVDDLEDLLDSAGKKKEKLEQAIQDESWDEVYDLLGGSDLDKRMYDMMCDEKLRSVDVESVSEDTLEGEKWAYTISWNDSRGNEAEIFHSVFEFRSEDEALEAGDNHKLSFDEVPDNVTDQITDEVKDELSREYGKYVEDHIDLERLDEAYVKIAPAVLEDLENYITRHYASAGERALDFLRKAWTIVSSNKPLGKDVERLGHAAVQKVGDVAKGAAGAVRRGVAGVKNAAQRVGRKVGAAANAFRGQESVVSTAVDRLLEDDPFRFMDQSRDPMADEEDVVGSTNMPHGHGYPNNKRDDEMTDDEHFDSVCNIEHVQDLEVGQDDAQDPKHYPLFVTLYDITRQYGGPEEGGWYYSNYEPIQSVEVQSPQEVLAAAKSLYQQAIGLDGKPRIDLEKVKGSSNKGAPHYESLREEDARSYPLFVTLYSKAGMKYEVIQSSEARSEEDAKKIAEQFHNDNPEDTFVIVLEAKTGSLLNDQVYDSLSEMVGADHGIDPQRERPPAPRPQDWSPQEMAERTSDAFSAPSYESWIAVCKLLHDRGFSDAQAEAILRSKWTRWARDMAGVSTGEARDLAAYLDKYDFNPECPSVQDLVDQTF